MLNAWAARWGVSVAALYELRSILIDAPSDPVAASGTSEAAIQAAVRVAASAAGWRLWRNNVGSLQDARGNWIRFGLCNDSAKLNEAIKSSDLVGIKPGGQFVAREVKAAGWRYTNTPREQAQLRWIEIITALGGDARFTTGEL